MITRVVGNARFKDALSITSLISLMASADTLMEEIKFVIMKLLDIFQ